MKNRSAVTRIVRVIAIALAVLVLLVLVNFIPALSLKTPGMRQVNGTYVTVRFETEEDAALDVFELAEARGGELSQLLGQAAAQPVEIYIYDRQSVMQTKKYGFIAPALHLDWYIGDNIGDRVILTSPAHPGQVHDYDTVRNAALHELVHAYNSLLNPRMTYWVDNGLAGYLSGQSPSYPVASYSPVPTLRQTRVNGPFAPIVFARFGGYEYSYTYVEYLVASYGWAAVASFAKSGDYVSCFGMDEETIYNGWSAYVRTAYAG